MTAPQLALLGMLCLAPGQGSQRVNPDAQIQKDFSDRVDRYVEVRKAIESQLPALPDRAEPEAITHHQKALLAGLQRARSGARPGDIFTEDIRHRIRRLIAGALSQQGSAPREAIREENAGNIPIRVNAAFPTSVALPTVPPQVLLALPRLPEELEYRFLGTRLLLLDSRANMVVDYMDHALRK